MSSHLDGLYPGKKRTLGHELWCHGLDVVEIGGGAYAFGYLMNRYREKASIAGIPADLLAGVGLTAASIACELTGRFSKLCPITKNLGYAGLASYAHTLGASAGAQKSGVKRLLASEGDVAKVRKLAPSAVVLGAIPKAPQGDFLSNAQLANLAR